MNIKNGRILYEMSLHAEVEYRLLLSSMGKTIPTPDMIEIFSYKCDNEWFRSEDFRMLLIQYRNGYYKGLVEDDKAERLREYRRRRREKRKKEKMDRMVARQAKKNNC